MRLSTVARYSNKEQTRLWTAVLHRTVYHLEAEKISFLVWVEELLLLELESMRTLSVWSVGLLHMIGQLHRKVSIIAIGGAAP